MKKKIYAALAFALYATTFHAQQIYELSAPAKEKTIYTGHLKMGGSNPSGGNISVNSYYMSIDGKPVIPVMESSTLPGFIPVHSGNRRL